MTNCAVVRTGALGDALMASATFPGLAQLGHRLTFVTTAEGEEMCRHDPYLNGRIRVVPRMDNENDRQLWAALDEEFDVVVNLVNGMECTMLFHPSQLGYYWPDEQRRRYASRSYLEQYMLQAGLEGPARIRFEPSQEELRWVAKTKDEIGPYVVWALRGSSVHKIYPFMREAIFQILTRTDLAIVLSGSLADSPLEMTIRDAVRQFLPHTLERVYSWVGDGSIRRSMALAQQAVAVVSPETALPMSVAHEPQVAKVVLLSHSSVKNLTGDWVNTTSLAPKVPCYPCHRLHYDFSYCPQDERTGAAVCAADIKPEAIADAVVAAQGRMHG